VGPLAISSIAVQGDFAQTNAWGAPVGPGASYTFSVTFTPTATGTRTGALTITDNAPGSPHVVQLSGAGTDFALEVQSGGSTSATVNAGQTGAYNLQIAPTGFSGNVALTCTWQSSQPRGTNCSVSPTSATLNGTDPTPFTVSVSTSARSLASPRGPTLPRMPEPWAGHSPPLLAWLLALAVLVMLGAPSRRRVYVGLAMSMLLVVLWVACGGGGGGSAPPPPPQTGTPAGTYSLTITGTAAGVSRTTSLTLKVN
jgi:hypothetical protein